MKNLFNAYFSRMLRQKFLLAGIVLAFAITYWFTSNGSGLNILHRINSDFDFSLAAALGIPAFMSLFTPLFLSAEYKGGTIRNKLICGKSRGEIYFATLLSVTAAMLLMTAAWAAGALLGAGTLPAAGVIAWTIAKMILYNIAYLTILVFISLNVTNEAAVTAIEFMSFQFSFFAVLMLQMVMGMTGDGACKVIAMMINLIPVGQWLSLSPLADESIQLSSSVQLILSAVLITAMIVYGMTVFRKKDIK
ncbi:hypothetical protein [Ruminococcus sp.]|uniref:hypothetical protein n=1 Tax=Ruminococcus sp. TaxID=41978 RepID=UPI0025DB31B8|nr:hypothetical protein [Ruminococcus sp.]MBQ8967799.1 hypothetical protein [Ruminococcus sp.]